MSLMVVNVILFLNIVLGEPGVDENVYKKWALFHYGTGGVHEELLFEFS